MIESNKMRIYDGVNSDVSFQITFIGNYKRKIKKFKYSNNVNINNNVLMNNCEKFYKERKKNYIQMRSDFTHFNVKKDIKTIYYPPLIITKNNNMIFCHVKIDDINNLRYIKFNFTLLSGELCFHNYIGDIENFMLNEITKEHGYKFYINNKEIRLDNLRQVINYYLKKARINELFYSTDHVILLTDNFTKIASKYLKREYLKKNLYVKNKFNKNITDFNNLSLILNAVYLSKYGNFVFVIENCENMMEEYEKLIPTLENSYDLLKEYIMMSEFLEKEYNKIQFPLKDSNKLKYLRKYLKQLYYFENLRNGLLNKSNRKVKLIIKEFEETCENIDFSKKLNRAKRYIEEKVKTEEITKKYDTINIIIRFIGEIFEKILNVNKN